MTVVILLSLYHGFNKHPVSASGLPETAAELFVYNILQWPIWSIYNKYTLIYIYKRDKNTYAHIDYIILYSSCESCPMVLSILCFDDIV